MTIMLLKCFNFIFIALISGVLANGSDQAGPRIIEGDYADPDGWPWIVELKYDGSHRCGGSILTEEWVITAAHCITDLLYGGHLSYLTVTAGIYNLNEYDNNVQVRCVEDFFIHHNYDFPNYDVALLKLSSKLNITRYVDAITLPAAGTKLVHGTELQVAGWGLTEEYIPSDVLKSTSQRSVDQQTCWMNYTKYYYNHRAACRITDSVLCASDPRYNSSACYGDSGGPLVGECPSTTPVPKHRENLIPRRPCLYGIVSGVPEGCVEENLPAIYVNVPAIVPWIMQTINSYYGCYYEI